MNSVIFRSAVRVVTPLMLLFSVLLLVRGHNEPGGGFAGGLIAATGVILHTLASGPGAARRLLRLPPLAFVAGGLLVAALSGLVGPAFGAPFLEAAWFKPAGIGTPLVFDVGVYLVVLGATLTVIEALAEDRT